jgi:CelD/BcsL family acetyltransferase involved in cellulose biosynthesis
VQISVVRPNELGPAEIAAWQSMQRQTSSLANPFLCPEFAVAVGNVRPEARVAVLADGPAILGFFPFERRRLGVGVPIGAGLSDCQGLIHAPGLDWDPRELLRGCRLAVWQFDHLVAGQQPFERFAVAMAPSPVIDLTEGFAAYQEKLQVKSPRFCRDLGRQMRKLERDAGELRFVGDARDTGVMRTLMGWKSEQSRQNEWIDVFARPWVADLVDYLFGIQGNRFSGLLSVCYAGDQPVAAQFGLRSESVFAGWFTAYDSRFGKYSPGLIQLMQMAEALAAAGIQTIDLGDGAASYKERLKSHDQFVAEGMAARRPALARAQRARSTMAAWARRQIKQYPPLFRAADRLLRHYDRIG